MWPQSISGIICYVKNVAKSSRFYETLGFTFRKKDPGHATAYLNWFWIDFVLKDKETRREFRRQAKLANSGAGVFVYIDVEDADRFHKSILSKGPKPSTESHDSPWVTENSYFGIPTATV